MDPVPDSSDCSPTFFTAREAQLLLDVIDIHVHGVLAAKDLTTTDPTIESSEDLLDLMSGYDDDLLVLNTIRHKLNMKGGGEVRDTADAARS